MERWPAPDFALRLTLNSGQVFHWTELDGLFRGAIGQKPFALSQDSAGLLIHQGSASVAARYLALDHDMATISATLPHDEVMRQAMAACQGMRLIRQPLWECLATFITSPMKQVAHIRQMSLALRRRHGERLDSDVYAYPGAARLAAATEDELRASGLGYRAANLQRTATIVAEGFSLEKLRELDDEKLRAALCELPGVGAKVANCVMLFAYERWRAFPVDVWIERALRSTYLSRRRQLTPRQIQKFADSHFGPYGGYAQQYLFHAARMAPRVPPQPR